MTKRDREKERESTRTRACKSVCRKKRERVCVWKRLRKREGGRKGGKEKPGREGERQRNREEEMVK